MVVSWRRQAFSAVGLADDPVEIDPECKENGESLRKAALVKMGNYDPAEMGTGRERHRAG